MTRGRGRLAAPTITTERGAASAAPPIDHLVRPVSFGALLLILGLHGPAALLFDARPAIATAAAAVLVVVVVFLVVASPTPGPLLHVAGYAVGSEVLWRATGATVPWELAKYLLILIFAGGIVRFVRMPRGVTIPVVLLASLLPACVVPLARFGPFGGLEPIVFNVGGLVALAIGVIFVSQLAGPWTAIRPTLWCVVAPVVGTATIATVSTRSLEARDFINESNFASAGGFGPNQVSVILGFAALCLIVLAVKETSFVRRALATVLAIWFLAQGGLTFSRGGLLNVALAVLAAAPFLLKRRTEGRRFLALVFVIGTLGALVIIPRLDQFTGGAIETRFTNFDEQDQRSVLIDRDVELFLDNPVLGTGVGESVVVRVDRTVVEAHTEWTRLIAEHGIAGVVAVVCLLSIVVRGVRGQRFPWARGWSMAFGAWAIVDLAHAATRIAAPSLAFALVVFTFIDEPSATDDGC